MQNYSKSITVYFNILFLLFYGTTIFCGAAFASETFQTNQTAKYNQNKKDSQNNQVNQDNQVNQVNQVNQAQNNDTKRKLVDAAMKARENSYSPYSNYKVGAALLTADGNIYTGCNIEISTYALSTCAERNAVFKAVTNGMKNFSMIAVVTKDGGSPCGCCRQVLNEFNPEIPIIIANGDGQIVRETNLAELFPHGWGPKNLNKDG